MDEVSKADRREIARVMFNEGLEKTNIRGLNTGVRA